MPHEETAMTTYAAISAFAATMRARILANKATLGNIVQVLDRDEDPDIIASNAKLLPIVCVIPLGQEDLNITYTMGGTNDVMSEFRVHVVGYFQISKDNKTPWNDLDTVARQYGLGIYELFRGYTGATPNFSFNHGVIYAVKANFTPYQHFDYVMARCLLTFSVKMNES